MLDKEARAKRIEWFQKARLGMFIHWGLYAIPARGEWVMTTEQISKQDYQKYFDEFNPDSYNPAKWAKTAKDAGMKYAVLTAKHHDGFCLFDSKFTNYKSTNTKANRDLVREFLDAFRKEGLKVGLYYSLIDWYHDDYQHFGERYHPMRKNQDYADKKHNFDKYLDYMHAQVKELCTNYGKLDIMWFDFSYDHMTGEAWRATELVKTIRTYQPDILIDNRLEVSGEGFGSLSTGNPSVYSGDFVSPEQIIPPYGLKDVNGNLIPWEACITMNDNWGYSSDDKNYKTAPIVIKKLIECVSKGGNLLLNVGPDARGCIPGQSLKILDEVGQWMNKNSESIYECGLSNLAKPENGRITTKENTLYYHIMEDSVGDIPLYGIKPNEVKQIRLLSDNSEIKVQKSWIVGNYPDVVFIRIGSSACLPDTTSTVVKVELVK